MKIRDVKISQLEHSQAKVDLYAKYLGIYLNVLERVPGVTHIRLFDLLCGEGIYTNNCLGSGCAAAKALKDHYFSNNQKCINTDLYLNDNGRSEIAAGKSKIQRNKELISTYYLPDNVTIHYTSKEYVDILQATIIRLDALKPSERALVFIDPYGYKEIRAEQLRLLLRNRRTELLLFLPASFIHRFAESSFTKDYPGAAAVRTLLAGVFPEGQPGFSNCTDFINAMRLGLKEALNMEYASSFTIQRNESNTFCLLFFTNSLRGYEKMLEVRWAMDEERGKGFRLNSAQTNLFSSPEIDNFEGQVREYISGAPSRTNHELKSFGLACEYLPKHVHAELKELKNKGQIEVKNPDGSPARSFYVNDENKTVYVNLKE